MHRKPNNPKENPAYKEIHAFSTLSDIMYEASQVQDHFFNLQNMDFRYFHNITGLASHSTNAY